MDTSPSPQNSPRSPEQPSGQVPESFGAPVGGEQASMPRPERGSADPGNPGEPAGQILPPPPPLMGNPVAATGDATNGAGGAGGVPPTASDVDVIEPEWVEKAEQTVRSHYGDPYGEEEAVEELQTDYLEKRYGYRVEDQKGTNKPEGK